MHAPTPQAKTVFGQALALEAAEERAAYLQQACGADAELLAEVEGLLAALENAGDFLKQPATPDLTVDSEPLREPRNGVSARASVEAVGSRVGPYKLLQLLGEGGMGRVWVAEQTEPFKRRVALKVIKSGMDSVQVLRRFEAERQALALMDHTNIAKVFDAGAAQDGRPYFAMELVKGVPITKYCDELQLPLRDRLALFIPVCAAIQHAHQKGIIHRDIKPSNVLVCIQDGAPAAKVIDFGVAKALHQRLAEESLYTEIGQIVGTLEYMSPEQAELSALDIDTRADVYALGVLLYELLTGTTPLDRTRLKSAAVLELLRLIREVEPPRPSTRLTDSKDLLPSLAAQRRTEPARLAKSVRGELDWIVMKALEKDRMRRYDSASGLARDVERYLHDELVEAGPPSSGYKLRKYASKHRRLLATALAFVGLLVLGATVSTWQAIRATAAERQAVASEEHQTFERLKAEAAEKQARSSEADMQAFREFLVQDVLSVARPKGEQGGLGIEVTVKRALVAAAGKISNRFRGRPRAEAIARHDLGETFSLVGDPDRAVEQLQKALDLRRQVLGPDHIDLLSTAHLLAREYSVAGKPNLALPILEENVKLLRVKLGPEDPETLNGMNELALGYFNAGNIDMALPLMQQVLTARKVKLHPDDPLLLLSMTNMGGLYRQAGKLDLALPLLEQAFAAYKLKSGPDDRYALSSMQQLASAYRDAEKLDQALPLYKKVLELRKAKLGLAHPDTLDSMNNLGLAYLQHRQPELAEPLLTQTLAATKEKLGPDHPDTLNSIHSLAGAYVASGKFDEAVALYKELLPSQIVKLGAEHPDTLHVMSTFGGAYVAAGKPDLALPLLEQTYAAQKVKLGPDHPKTLKTMHNLAVAYWEVEKLDRSIPLLEEALRINIAKYGKNHPSTIHAKAGLGCDYRDAGRLQEAISLLEEAHKQSQKLDPFPADLGYVLEGLARTYDLAGQTDKGESLYVQFLDRTRKQLGSEHTETASALSLLGLHLLEQKKFVEAEPVLRECLAIRVKSLPDNWLNFNAQSLLGGALLGQKKFAEAGPLLQQGYEGMKLREDKIRPKGKVRLVEALERLVQFYEATGKKDQADEWRKKLKAQQSQSTANGINAGVKNSPAPVKKDPKP